jgi:hypothetical protein
MKKPGAKSRGEVQRVRRSKGKVLNIKGRRLCAARLPPFLSLRPSYLLGRAIAHGQRCTYRHCRINDPAALM